MSDPKDIKGMPFARIDLSDFETKSERKKTALKSNDSAKEEKEEKKTRRSPARRRTRTADAGAKKVSAKAKEQQDQEQPRAKQQEKKQRPSAKKAAPAAAKQPSAKDAESPRRRQSKRRQSAMGRTLRVIPLGGIGEIGKNMTVYECGDDAFIIDCGLSFPDDELFGVDIVIPDYAYAKEIRCKLRGIFITHAHEDHIGALPYFLKDINIPVYGTKLTIGLIKSKLEEREMVHSCTFIEIEPGQKIKAGCMTLEAISVNHSIPDAVAFAIETPLGTLVHTGDFKIDFTPVIGRTTDLQRLGDIGSSGVLALLSDSTNAEKPGFSKTEKAVRDSFEQLFARAEGKRLIIATFSSNINRIQQFINLAKRHGRKIAFSGRSMENYTRVAAELGYLDYDQNIMVEINSISKCKPSDLIIITTGSQGEPLSALARMAAGTHKHVSITKDDFIIISATPIPGNEKNVTRVVNQLLKLGSEVIYESMYDVHASGHACSGEHQLMLNLVKPKYFIPIHGEYRHLKKHSDTALNAGIDRRNIFIPETGQVLEFSENGLRRGETVQSGRVLVDGSGVGDVGSVVLRDRKHLAQDGLLVVVCSIDIDTKELLSGPDVISRGFVYVKESDALFDEARKLTVDVIKRCQAANVRDWSTIKSRVRDALSDLMYQRTKRSPMILPIIMEI